MHPRQRPSAAVFTLILPLLAAPLYATSYSTVSINSATSVYVDLTPDTLTAPSGVVQLSAAGSNTYAYNNGTGGFTHKPTTDDVFARASLVDGELKAKSILAFGPSAGAAMPVGQNNGSASATATFADSFSTYAGSSPFLWSDGDSVTFEFAITGQYSLPPGILAPTGFEPGQIKNLVTASLRFQAYTPGGLDLLQQLTTFDFNTRPYEEFSQINAQLQSKRIPDSLGFWYLGDPVAYFDVDPASVLHVNPDSPTEVTFSFNPNGDFEWVLTLDTLLQLDASLQNVTASLDFSHTIQTNYIPPPGTTTFSSSGHFPGTLPIPEPATLSLLIPAFALLTRRRSA